MEKLTPAEITTLLAGFALMLAVARAFGEIFNHFRQPAIVGEILAGILLGPTVFGALFPGTFSAIFPATGPVAIAYHTVITLAVVFLLLIAGLEIDLSVLWRQGKAALLISVFGTAVPFLVGFAAAYAAPAFWGIEEGADVLTFALFFGTALSISALPVIAKIMMDLDLFKTDVGMLVMGAAMFSDLVGWIIFSIVLGMMNVQTAEGSGGLSVGMTITLTLLLVAFSLTIGRGIVHRFLPWVQSRLSWPGGVLSLTLVLTLAGAAATEAIGIHAIFGAFLVGIAIGDSTHMRPQTRSILHQFVTYIFAPIFFVSIGLEADFLGSFNWSLTLGVLVVAFAGKIVGCLIGARLGNLPVRDSWAIALGMNARGAMEIILGLLAMQYGVIQSEMFVALVVLALLSSIVSGPMMKMFVSQPKVHRLEDLLTTNLFLPSLQSDSREGVIHELVAAAASAVNIDEERVVEAVLKREAMIGTGLGDEIAIPHVRVSGLMRPVLVVGHSENGVDFGGPDDLPARLIFLILMPEKEMTSQVQIMAQIARFFGNDQAREAIYESRSVDTVRAMIKPDAGVLDAHCGRTES